MYRHHRHRHHHHRHHHRICLSVCAFIPFAECIYANLPVGVFCLRFEQMEMEKPNSGDRDSFDINTLSVELNNQIEFAIRQSIQF